MATSALVEGGIDRETAESWCAAQLYYQRVDAGVSYDELATRVEKLESEHGLPGDRVFYLALPPSKFATTIGRIGESKLDRTNGWIRLVIEKPFGTDLESAHELNAAIHKTFTEDEVFRIDHYLGKETVRNLLVFRFANSLFERTWNRDHVESVEITVAETQGIEGRVKYYDESGAVRDMVQSHLTQLLTLIAMEPPVRMDADAIRSEKVKVLKAVEVIDRNDADLGQYGPGEVDGSEVDGYVTDMGLAAPSSTPTFAAARVEIDSWRWQGVPFYLRTGKRLPRRVTKIIVRYRRPPICLFHDEPGCTIHQNELILTLQPDEGFDLLFDIKSPGDAFHIQKIPLSVRYDEYLGELPDAYHTLIRDVLEGDPTLFVRSDEVEESWRVWGDLIGDERVELYPAGTWGPPSAGTLPQRDGNEWSVF